MVVNVTDTTMSLSWMPSEMPNGIITHYQVQYRRSDNRSSFASLNITNVDQIYTVTGLDSNTEYVFVIRAFTVVGHGAPSDEVTHYTSKLLYSVSTKMP